MQNHFRGKRSEIEGLLALPVMPSDTRAQREAKAKMKMVKNRESVARSKMSEAERTADYVANVLPIWRSNDAMLTVQIDCSQRDQPMVINVMKFPAMRAEAVDEIVDLALGVYLQRFSPDNFPVGVDEARAMMVRALRGWLARQRAAYYTDKPVAAVAELGKDSIAVKAMGRQKLVLSAPVGISPRKLYITLTLAS